MGSICAQTRCEYSYESAKEPPHISNKNQTFSVTLTRMTKSPNTAYCTDVRWLGRANCGKCHIRHLMLFSALPEVAFDNLLQPIIHQLYPAESLIYSEISKKKSIYSIRKGMVKLVHVSKDGTQRIVRILGPGAAIGLELLESAKSYHHTAFAVTDIDLCIIPVETVKQLEKKYPDLCLRVRKQLQDQLDLADQWIYALGTGSAKQRVAQLILILEEHYSDENRAFLLLNRDDMSAMTSIASETISRTIAGFKRQNILSKTKGNLYSCNIKALEEMTQAL